MVKPSITINDLSEMTNQSYEKARRDFSKIKTDYVNNRLKNKEHLSNARELPLNNYTLKTLELWYGLNKEKIIDNIKVLEELQ